MVMDNVERTEADVFAARVQTIARWELLMQRSGHEQAVALAIRVYIRWLVHSPPSLQNRLHAGRCGGGSISLPFLIFMAVGIIANPFDHYRWGNCPKLPHLPSQRRSPSLWQQYRRDGSPILSPDLRMQ